MLDSRFSICIGGILMFSFLSGNAQQQPAKRICDTIHYEYIRDKIVIPVTVNGVKVKYIVDTGGQTGTDWEHVKEMKGTSMGSFNPIADLNDKQQLYQLAEVRKVQFSPNYTIDKMQTMVFPVMSGFREMGVVGLLGGDAFSQAVITFDARQQIMVISHPYRPNHVRSTEGTEIFPGNAHHSIVDMDFGGIKKRVLFDTGAQGFLFLNAGDFKEMEGKNAEKKAVGFGINGVGLEGLSQPTEMAKVNVRELSVLGKKFVNIGSVISDRSSTIVGVELLKYGKVMIDYIRNRFYFFPFEPDAVTEMGGPQKTWNVDILPANAHFEITTVWESIKDAVAFGDQVIDINGTDITSFPMSQLEINKVMEAIEGDTAYIIVLKDGKKKKIEIHRE